MMKTMLGRTASSADAVAAPAAVAPEERERTEHRSVRRNHEELPSVALEEMQDNRIHSDQLFAGQQEIIIMSIDFIKISPSDLAGNPAGRWHNAAAGGHHPDTAAMEGSRRKL